MRIFSWRFRGGGDDLLRVTKKSRLSLTIAIFQTPLPVAPQFSVSATAMLYTVGLVLATSTCSERRST